MIDHEDLEFLEENLDQAQAEIRRACEIAIADIGDERLIALTDAAYDAIQAALEYLGKRTEGRLGYEY